jgi:peptidoglycan/xylan/chitin deacetylase (PgdA/CDA1 family)
VKKLTKHSNEALFVLLLMLLIFGLAYYVKPIFSIRDKEEIHEEHTQTPSELLEQYERNTNVGTNSKYLVSSTTPQFVLLSFDGSKSVDMLNETLNFARKMTSLGKNLHFTYFINAAYFLTKDNSYLYQGPNQPVGKTNIGFSDREQDIADRVKVFNSAILEGHEVGSHTVGHFNGAHWSYEEWAKEFKSFNRVIADIQKNNPNIRIGQATFDEQSIIGFRAPELAINDNLYRVLKDFGFRYDASNVGRSEDWPHKDINNIWHIPLGTIKIGKNHSPAVAMDYSLWMHHSFGVDEVRKGTDKWKEYHDEVLTAYIDYFTNNYQGDRAPVIIGHHFVKMNDGVYWEAMKDFADKVCGLKHVKCVTFRELVNYLDLYGVPPLK